MRLKVYYQEPGSSRIDEVGEVYIRTVWGMEYYASAMIEQNMATEARVFRSPSGGKEGGEVRVLFYRRTKPTAKAPTGYLVICGTDIFAGPGMHWLHITPKMMKDSDIDDPELKEEKKDG